MRALRVSERRRSSMPYDSREDLPLLRTAPRHGEDHLHEATAAVTLGPLTTFAPGHGVP